MARQPRTGLSAQSFLTQLGPGKTFQSWPPKHTVFAQGDKADAVYYLQDGGKVDYNGFLRVHSGGTLSQNFSGHHPGRVLPGPKKEWYHFPTKQFGGLLPMKGAHPHKHIHSHEHVHGSAQTHKHEHEHEHEHAHAHEHGADIQRHDHQHTGEHGEHQHEH